MLDFERQLVATLTDVDDPGLRARVAGFVEASLHAMPEHLRLGVLVQSVAFAAWTKIAPTDDLAGRLERSPIPLVRQHVRLFRSLVLFAEQELATTA
ncbi:MAG: hypothetical protein QOF60_1609 [Actinomycetota bacterium]|jgi:hypothetical protein|nr:hypothetical protein [Actinomycetota bacterium]